MKGLLIQALTERRGNLPFTESLALKAVSILLALILWITILGLKREDLLIQVKLEPLLPAGMMVTNKVPTSIQFTLTGPRVWLRVAQKGLAPIRPDLRHTRASNIEFSISDNLLADLPATVKVKDYYPQQVSINLEEVVERYVLVRPTLEGSPKKGYEVVKTLVTPAKVAVSGPRHLLESEDFVGTSPFSIQDLQGVREGDVEVEVDENKGYQLSREKVVRLRVQTRRAITGER